MKHHTLWPLLLLTLIAGCGGDQAELSAEDKARAFDKYTTEIVVDLEDGTALSTFLGKHKILSGVSAEWNSPNVADEAIAVLQVPLSDQAAVLAAIKGDPLVESAELNGLMQLPENLTPWAFAEGVRNLPDDDSHTPLDGFPNDPLFERQWNMQMVGAKTAWNYSTGQDIIVAVIDTGVAYEDKKGLFAPDLQRTKFVEGWDFVNNDPIAADDHGHGTHCAGTIAQSTNNKRGVIGLAYNARIMPLKVLSAQGWGTTSDIADAIRFAADNGANVISMSLGGGGYSKVMNSACEYAASKGVAVVCAAGNSGRARVEFPAAYPACISVSSVGPSGKLAFYSSHGRGLDLAAPGGDQRKNVEDGILQNALDLSNRTNPKTVYAYYQGTSMATPHVAAAAGLLFEAGVTRPDAIRSILHRTAKGDGWNEKYGHGILDAGAAVRHAIFVPAASALFFGLVLAFFVTRMAKKGRSLSTFLVAGGVLAGSAGLFFLRPLGVGELPIVGDFLVRGLPDWDTALLGASWHWNAIFASALIPAFIGAISIPSKFTRSIGVGIMLGWSARMVSGVLFPYADVQFIPGAGLLDAVWLLGNAGVLLLLVAPVIRLGKNRGRVTL